MKVDPNAPAYPCPRRVLSDGSTCPDGYSGLPIRLEIASRVLAGMAASDRWADGLTAGPSEEEVAWRCQVAISALVQADALIAAHNETQETPA